MRSGHIGRIRKMANGLHKERAGKEVNLLAQSASE
jgi:hypothetical protein